MEIASVCLMISATLSIQPDRTQFFLGESFRLSCGIPESCSGWKVMRNATEFSVPCERWGRTNGSICIIRRSYKLDGGTYWCQSEKGNHSNILTIKINHGSVNLESPALPVTEGSLATLSCSYKEKNEPKPDFRAKFYRNDTFIGEREGKLIIPAVSMFDKGMYHCEHQTKGKSPRSWLDVKAKAPLPNNTPPPLWSFPSLMCTILLFVVYTIIFVVCMIIYRRWARARVDAERRNSDHLRPDY